MTHRLRIATGLLCLAASAAAVAAPAVQPDEEQRREWDGISKVVAVGDVSGALDPLATLLEGVGLVDGNLAWTGGDAHLVFIGDLVDRGDEDREVLDLARRLQGEAAAAGGRVHVLLGNHEAMNLTRDFRYVSEASFAAFSDLERPADRRAAWKRLRFKEQSSGMSTRAFEEIFPPGYFGRIRAFSPDGEYGAWLLEQPTAIKINGYVFVHAGLTPEVAALGLEGINQGVRAGFFDYQRYAAVLDETVPGLPDYAELHRMAREKGAREFLELAEALPFAPGGPLWYRGGSLENERIERAPVREALERLEARAMVVGHTPTRSGAITSRFNETLYRTDVGAVYRGRSMAWILEEDRVRAFDAEFLAYGEPLREGGMGEGWPSGQEELADALLERFLARAKIENVEELRRGDRRFLLVALKDEGLHLRAIFGSADEAVPADLSAQAPRPRRYRHELAAYRLDRMLGLDFVPVTVERKLEQKNGALQLFLEGAVDLPYIQEHGRYDLLYGLEAEVREAIIFSALVGSRDRIDAAKMLLPEKGRVMIADSTRGFPLSEDAKEILSRRVGEFDPGPCRPMDARLELKLGELNKKMLQEELGDYISPQQIDALLGRRDRILALCGSKTNGSDRPAVSQ